jgi:hypothetical protein
MSVRLPPYLALTARQGRRRSWLLAACLLAGTHPAAGDALLDEAFALEREALAATWSLARLERALLIPDDDQLVVLFSVPLGAPIVLERIEVRLNGKAVVEHPFTGFELERFLDGAVQPLYMTRLPPGEHRIEVAVRVIAGGVKPTPGYTFVKGERVKFVLIALDGFDYRRVQVTDW